MDEIEEACKSLWKMLDTLNTQNQNGGKDAEQYHHVVSALYKLNGLKMIEEYENDGGNSYRGGVSRRGGYSRMYFDPWYGPEAYSYGGEEWESMDGASGARYQRRDSIGRFSREGGNRGGSYDGGSYESGERGGNRGGNSRNGGSYGSAAEHLKAALREARTEDEREAIRRAMRDMESGM